MAYLVHDAVAGTGARLLSFNAQQMRMISASRKKTDRRDAYWIARALQTAMHPHPVYLPTGRIQEVRALLSQRRMILMDRNRWQVRARSVRRGSGWKIPRGGYSLGQALTALLETPTGVDTYVLEMLELCQRQVTLLGEELVRVDGSVREATKGIDAMRIEGSRPLFRFRDRANCEIAAPEAVEAGGTRAPRGREGCDGYCGRSPGQARAHDGPREWGSWCTRANCRQTLSRSW